MDFKIPNGSKKEIKIEIRIYFELQENENTIYKSLWDTPTFKEKFTVLNVYSRKKNRLKSVTS